MDVDDFPFDELIDDNSDVMICNILEYIIKDRSPVMLINVRIQEEILFIEKIIQIYQDFGLFDDVKIEINHKPIVAFISTRLTHQDNSVTAINVDRNGITRRFIQGVGDDKWRLEYENR